MSSFVTIVSKSGDKFQVDTRIERMSELLENVIANDPDGTEDIPVNVPSGPLKAFLTYCEHYNYEKEKTTIVYPLVSSKPEDFITDEWERSFIQQFDQTTILDLLEAANFLNCPALFELCCAMVAADFKAKEFEELKKEYGLYDVEYTPEDEEEIMKEHPWILEESEARIKKLKAENGIQ